MRVQRQPDAQHAQRDLGTEENGQRHPAAGAAFARGGEGEDHEAGEQGACAVQQAWVWLALAAMGVVLLTKALLEERWMTEQHPDYADYQSRTKRFVPWLL